MKGIARDVGGSTRMSFLVFGSKSPGRGMRPVGSREPDKHSVAGQMDVHTLESWEQREEKPGTRLSFGALSHDKFKLSGLSC